MLKLSVLKENIVALLIALVLAIIVVFAINKSDMLKADVLSSQQQSEVLKGEILYEYKGDNIMLKSKRDFGGIEAFSVVISFDSQKTKVSADDIDTRYDYGISQIGEGRINLILTDVGNLSNNQDIISIKYKGDQQTINFSDANITFTDGSSENLSIGVPAK